MSSTNHTHGPHTTGSNCILSIDINVIPRQLIMSKNESFCTNCGRSGHVYGKCKFPIMSIGIVAFRYGDRGREYLLIRRKDTLGYVDFMRGKYSLNDRDHMQSLIDEMSMDEKKRLLKYDFDHLWRELWGGKIGMKYRNEENVSRDKSNTLKDGVPTHDFPCDLEQLINASTTSWKEPEWGFPKGRRNYLEIPMLALECDKIMADEKRESLGNTAS